MKCKRNNAARLIRAQGEQMLRGEEYKNVRQHGKNAEGYPDPTAGSAWRNIRKEENRRDAERVAVIGNLIPIMKQTAELAGFEVVGRIVLKDKRTGKEYR